MRNERKEKAIAWLNDEIRSLELAPELNGCHMTPEWAEQLEIMRTCLEAVQLSDFAEVSKQAEREYYAGFSSNTANIDREACGCPYCTPDAEGYVRKFGAFSIHDGMLETGHCKPQEIKYCPHCSRQLTEEAWDELEKRLRG